MDFGTALKLIQKSPGCRISRASWLPANEHHVIAVDQRLSKVHVPPHDVIEYTPTQEDLFAGDWEIVR